nr:SMI1/KNR4 family protein [Fimbriiglobus sp.]
MMKRKTRDAATDIRRRIPEGGEWPSRFEALVEADPPLRIEWNSLRAFHLNRTADREVVPFLHLFDGGLVAFWYREPSPAVVCIDHDGRPMVVAPTFDDFLRRINVKRTGIPDIDEGGRGYRVPGVRGRPTLKGLAELQ